MIQKLLLASLLALGACATQPNQTAATAAPTGRDCFFVRDITAQEALDDRTIKLTARHIDYILHVHANARQLNYAEPLIVEAPTGQMCTGNGLGIRLHVGTDPAHPVIIRDIARAPAPATQG